MKGITTLIGGFLVVLAVVIGIALLVDVLPVLGYTLLVATLIVCMYLLVQVLKVIRGK